METIERSALGREAWHTRREQHHRRATVHTQPYRERRERGETHAVLDFLFVYYSYKPAFLERWHPGVGISLLGADADSVEFNPRHYGIERSGDDCVIFADPAKIGVKGRRRIEWILQLLQRVQTRPANFGCSGMHEWAMVYQAEKHDGAVRHEESLPLRLPQETIDAFVASRPICCSHFDAFRFFTPTARPLNRIQPAFDTRLANEQGACLHVNMDLYKWAAKGMPWIESDLLLDCFELAVQARELDMRASPYDVSSLGYAAVPIETPEGRAQYEQEQRALAAAAQLLRERLIAKFEQILEQAPR